MTELIAGGKFARKYKLKRRVGEGKFKETWKAKDIIMKRDIALKIIKENIALDQLVEEASRQTKIGKHPNVAEIFDAAIDSETGLAYLTEEYIEGVTLKQEITKSVDDTSIIEISRQIANGLQFIHNKKIIHRDLKPENIFLKSDKKRKKVEVIISDWGGSTKSGTEHIPIDGIHGSILFRAPEALDGNTDPKVDMFSLGVLMYWMKTGKYPFTGENYEKIKEKLRYMIPERPSKYPEVTIQPKLEKIIMKLLNKDPRKRYNAKQLKRKLWLYNNRKKIAVITGIVMTVTPILSLIGLLGTLHTIGIFKAMTLPKKDLEIMYLNSKRLKHIESIHPCRRQSDCNIRLKKRNLLPDEIESYTRWGNKIFAVTKKDIYMYDVEKINSKGTMYTQNQITKTPDQEETNIQLSPNGNFLAYMIGRNLHTIRIDGRFERTVLENIDEYVWCALKEQITYRKGNTMYITGMREAPFAEQNARKIEDGIHPQWTDDGSYIFYLIKNENETSICVKECGCPDFITGAKKLPGWKMRVDKSVQQFFLTRNCEVLADKFSLAYFSPEQKQITVIKEKLGKSINATRYPMRNFQNIQQIVFSPDMDGILFSGKRVQEQDYEIYYAHLKPAWRLLQLTNNQEDDTDPTLFRYKSLE